MPGISIPKEFHYFNCRLDDLGVLNREGKQYITYTDSKLNVCEFVPTQRFWDSIYSRFGISPTMFNVFTHKEVFNRITVKNPNIAHLRIAGCIEIINNSVTPLILGTTDPTKHILDYHHIMEIIRGIDIWKGHYNEGILSLELKPNSQLTINAGEDILTSTYLVDIPLDGYGRPTIWLGYTYDKITGYMDIYTSIIACIKDFQSVINIPDEENCHEAFRRVIQNFSNEEGHCNLKDRILCANNSWASVAEIMTFIESLAPLENEEFEQWALKCLASPPPDAESNWQPSGDPKNFDRGVIRAAIIKRVYDLSGDIREIYDVAQINAIPDKRKLALPTKTTIYEIIKLASRCAYWVLPRTKAILYGYIGRTLSREFDLEDSMKIYPTFENFPLRR